MKDERTKTPASAAIYVRISSDPKGRELGVTRQREDCVRLAEELGWRVAEIYEDNDTSASKGAPRPAYDRMIADCTAGRRDAIIVYNVTRLTRQLSQFAGFMDWRRKHEIPFATREGDNTETASGRYILNQKASLAEHEAELIGERVARAALQRAKNGQMHAGGTRPFGWSRRKRGGGVVEVVNPREAAVIREVRDRLLAGESLRSVTTDLHRRGVKTTQGKRWASTTVRRMMLRPRLAGLVEYQGEVLRDDDGQPIRGQWEPIISVEEHEQLVALLTDPSRSTGPRGTYVYLLSNGVLRCGICGGRMNGKPRQGQRAYHCMARGGSENCGRLRVVAEPLDALVSEAIFAALDSSEFADALKNAAADSSESEEAASRAAVADLRAKLDRLEIRYAMEEFSKSAYGVARERLTRQLEDAESKLAKFVPVGDITSAPRSGVEARRLWEARDVEWRRMLVSTLIEQVTINPAEKPGRNYVDPARVGITWRF
jgi:DNA invertase Pin-like site-specific DNA recombinase